MSRLNYSVLSVEAIASVSSSINSLKVGGVVWCDKSQKIVKLIYFWLINVFKISLFVKKHLKFINMPYFRYKDNKVS